MGVVEGKPLKRLAEELGIPYHKAQYLFHKWCKLNNRRSSEFHEVELMPSSRSSSGVVPVVRTYVPSEAERWIRERLKRPVITGPLGHKWSNKKVLERKLGRKITTIADLSRRLGIRAERVKREFKWWCYIHGKNPHDFYRPGVGYMLPEGFVEYMEQLVKKFREVEE